jgi:hypothetical protein
LNFLRNFADAVQATSDTKTPNVVTKSAIKAMMVSTLQLEDEPVFDGLDCNGAAHAASKQVLSRRRRSVYMAMLGRHVLA